MTDLSADYSAGGKPLPEALLPIVEDAAQAVKEITDVRKRSDLTERIERVRRGHFDAIIVRRGHRLTGLIAVKPMGDGARLIFGHVLQACEEDAPDVLKVSMATLASRGFKVITSTFNWPAPEAFVRAAAAAGFVCVERMDMSRETDPGLAVTRPAADVEIGRWSPDHFDAVAALLFENEYPGDRVINPLSGTLEGCRSHLRHIVEHQYGEFVPGLSFVALHQGRPVGFLLSSAQPRGDILIVELAVDRQCRGRGIASSLICGLIRGDDAEKRQIELTVTLSNHEAVRLYERLGFRARAMVGYYIFVPGA